LERRRYWLRLKNRKLTSSPRLADCNRKKRKQKMQIRQGDIFFQPIDAIPDGAKQIPSGVIVQGQATGHAHRIVGGELFADGDSMFIRSDGRARLEHPEHQPPIELPRGAWRVVRQREYTPEGLRNVED
jgi:hypothetical protein